MGRVSSSIYKKENKLMKPKKDAFDNWFDKKVIVMGMGKGTRNKKIHNIIKKKVKEQLIKQVKKEEQ